jgi:putative membrane protein
MQRSVDVYASAAMAIVHHLAAFTVVAALAVEVALFKPPLSLTQARRLLRTDFIFGASATVVLVVGMLRVAFFV